MSQKDDLAQTRITLSFMLKMLNVHKWKFILGIFCMLISGTASLLFPYLLKDLVDSLTSVGKGVVTNLPKYFIIMAIIVIVQSTATYGKGFFFVSLSENLIERVRNQFYKSLLDKPMSFYAGTRIGELTNCLSSDLLQIKYFLNVNLSEILKNILLSVLATILLINISISFTTIVVLLIPISLFLGRFGGKRLRLKAYREQEQAGFTNNIAAETLQNIKVVKVFCNERFEYVRFRRSLRQLKLRSVNLWQFSYLFSSSFFLLFSVIQLIFLWKGSNLFLHGLISFGELVEASFFILILINSIISFGDLLPSMERAKAAFHRLNSYLLTPSEVTESKRDIINDDYKISGEFEMKDLHFSYPTTPGQNILNGLNLKVKAGEKVALLGKSGSGKSTFCALICTLFNPTSGQLRFDGRNACDIPVYHLRRQISIVPQETRLFSGTIKENIEYGKTGATEDEIILAAQLAFAHEFILQLPNGYNTYLGDNGLGLSGGERQRIAIARAILKDAPLLILDEATNELDEQAEDKVLLALNNLIQNKTCIVISHNFSNRLKMDRILKIDQGFIYSEIFK